MELYHIKFKNGEDLLGYIDDIATNLLEIRSPITVSIDPHLGLFAKSWLLFSDTNSAVIDKSNVILLSKASNTASEYYNEFIHKQQEHAIRMEYKEASTMNQELEDIFTAMIESKNTIRKH